jgi:hypothetical protein
VFQGRQDFGALSWRLDRAILYFAFDVEEKDRYYLFDISVSEYGTWEKGNIKYLPLNGIMRTSLDIRPM